MFVKDDVIEIVAGELYSAALYCGMLPQKHDNTHAHTHTHIHTHTHVSPRGGRPPGPHSVTMQTLSARDCMNSSNSASAG